MGSAACGRLHGFGTVISCTLCDRINHLQCGSRGDQPRDAANAHLFGGRAGFDGGCPNLDGCGQPPDLGDLATGL